MPYLLSSCLKIFTLRNNKWNTEWSSVVYGAVKIYASNCHAASEYIWNSDHSIILGKLLKTASDPLSSFVVGATWDRQTSFGVYLVPLRQICFKMMSYTNWVPFSRRGNECEWVPIGLKKWYIIQVPFQWRGNYLWMGTNLMTNF